MKVGILGNGQLARMLALAGKPLGMDFVFYDANPDGCANVMGDGVYGKLTEANALKEFADGVDVVTFENENIPQVALDAIPVEKMYPPAQAIVTSQDRLLEKQFIEKLGIALPKYYIINSEQDLHDALQQNQGPLVLKTRRNGYDGRGQARIKTPQDVAAAWKEFSDFGLIAEAMVNFQREISMIAVRGKNGEIRFYPITENDHHDGILHTSIVQENDPLQAKAEDYTRRLLEELNYVGVLGFEFFDCDGELLANEFAPRVHNTGHWSIDGAEISQFENHLRAVCGLPLGDTRCEIPSIMCNIIGGFPALEEVLKIPGAHMHHYQKEPRSMRKIGHVTICHHDQQKLEEGFQQINRLITKR